MNEINIIDSNRTKLLKALSVSLTNPSLNKFPFPERLTLASIVNCIINDDLKHYLSYHMIDNNYNYISYARLVEDKYVLPKRVITSLARYLSKKYPEYKKSISDNCIYAYVCCVKQCIKQDSGDVL